MPKIISVINSKGGAGKTTTVVNLASALAEDYRVAVADGDPQRSVLSWFKKARAPFTLQAASIKQLMSLADNPNSARFDFIIIDTPAGIHPELSQELAALSNLIIIPAKCSLLDVEPALNLMKQLEGKSRACKILLTQVQVGAKTSVNTIKRMLYQRNMPFFKTSIRQLEAHVHAAINHQTVFEMGYPGRAARLDYLELMSEIEDLIAQGSPVQEVEASAS